MIDEIDLNFQKFITKIHANHSYLPMETEIKFDLLTYNQVSKHNHCE